MVLLLLPSGFPLEASANEILNMMLFLNLHEVCYVLRLKYVTATGNNINKLTLIKIEIFFFLPLEVQPSGFRSCKQLNDFIIFNCVANFMLDRYYG